MVFPDVRNAESALSRSRSATSRHAEVGPAMRVLPPTGRTVSVYVDGRIVHSDGQTLELDDRHGQRLRRPHLVRKT